MTATARKTTSPKAPPRDVVFAELRRTGSVRVAIYEEVARP